MRETGYNPSFCFVDADIVSLRLFYKLAAAAVAAYALAVIVSPGVLFVVIDPVSAAVNAANIRLSFFVLAIWLLVVLLALVRTRPTTSHWPRPAPIWLGVVWLLLCVAYTAFEHGWVAFPAFVYEEDGLLEWATAVLLLVCAILLLRTGTGPAWRRDRRLGSGIVALAVVSVFLLMEEISWGQRIFGWSTPEEFAELNAQSETNLHNMFVGYNQLIRLVISLVIASALIWREAWTRQLDRFALGALMPAPVSVYFVPFLIYAHTYDELYEEVVVVFMVAYALNLHRRLAARPPTGH